MAKQIKTAEPFVTLSHNKEQYTSDKNGLVTVPDEAAKSFIESHGCTDPDAQHKYGLSVQSHGKGKFIVVNEDGNSIHGGAVDFATAQALIKSWSPAPVEEEISKEEKKTGKK